MGLDVVLEASRATLGVVKKLSLHFRFLLAAFPLACQSRMRIRSFQDRGKTAQNNSGTVALIFERLLTRKLNLTELFVKYIFLLKSYFSHGLQTTIYHEEES